MLLVSISHITSSSWPPREVLTQLLPSQRGVTLRMAVMISRLIDTTRLCRACENPHPDSANKVVDQGLVHVTGSGPCLPFPHYHRAVLGSVAAPRRGQIAGCSLPSGFQKCMERIFSFGVAAAQIRSRYWTPDSLAVCSTRPLSGGFSCAAAIGPGGGSCDHNQGQCT
jgi:hypothetical protein